MTNYYKELRVNGLKVLNNEIPRENPSEISQKDIEFVNQRFFRAILIPTGFAASLMLFRSAVVATPRVGKFFRNPLRRDSEYFEPKWWQNGFSYQSIVVLTFGVTTYQLIKYEMTKFWLFIKYQNIVDNYMRREQMKKVKLFKEQTNKITLKESEK